MSEGKLEVTPKFVRYTEAIYKENERKLHENRIVMKTCHKFPAMRHVIIFNLSLLVHYFFRFFPEPIERMNSRSSENRERWENIDKYRFWRSY